MGGGSDTSMTASEYPQLVKRPKGKQIHSIYADRLRQFTDGGQYYQDGLLSYCLHVL
jgi:alpha-mannosidase